MKKLIKASLAIAVIGGFTVFAGCSSASDCSSCESKCKESVKCTKCKGPCKCKK